MRLAFFCFLSERQTDTGRLVLLKNMSAKSAVANLALKATPAVPPVGDSADLSPIDTTPSNSYLYNFEMISIGSSFSNPVWPGVNRSGWQIEEKLRSAMALRRVNA